MYFQQQFIDKIFLKELKGLYLVLEKTLRQSTRGPGRNKLQQVATNEFHVTGGRAGASQLVQFVEREPVGQSGRAILSSINASSNSFQRSLNFCVLHFLIYWERIKVLNYYLCKNHTVGSYLNQGRIHDIQTIISYIFTEQRYQNHFDVIFYLSPIFSAREGWIIGVFGFKRTNSIDCP